jgi:hypothetical protein
MKRLSIAALLLLLGTNGVVAQATPDATARFLAGISADGVPLGGGDAARAWTEHASEFGKAWDELERRQLAPIREWAPQFLEASYDETAPLFYMFSGPDFLYAHAFFPRASTYILCGTEPIGPLPDVGKIPPAVLGSALTSLRKSLESVLSWSFFITKNMKTDLNQTQLNGTLPVLYVFLARAGCTIETVENVALDGAGNFVAAANATTPGVKIVFRSTDGSEQTLYYFSTDLSDDGIAARPGFIRFCEAQGRGSALLKAASYLLHQQNFGRVREFLLSHSSIIVQDDSGIPHRFFAPEKWTLRYCGHYVGAISAFKEFPQPDLAQAFATTMPAPLPFAFGYQWQPNRSSLVIARPRVPSALRTE